MSSLENTWRRWRQEGGVFDLSSHTKLRVSGADRIRYLNGQVTADVKLLSAERALPACVPTAKGKLSAVVHLAAEPDAVIMDADADVREELLARLERYIVADDVVIEDVTDTYDLLHFTGADPRPSLAQLGVAAGALRGASRFGVRGWDLLLPRSDEARFQDALFADENANRLLPPELAEIIRVEAGVPRWGAELGPDTLPPEAGLDRTHVSYTKGCYIGQEVISRLKSVGHVNRRLTGFVAAADPTALPAGAQLFSQPAPEPGERPIGQLTSAIWSFALAKPVALGYLRRGSPEEDLFAQPAENGGERIRVSARELPFVSPPTFA